MVDNVWNMLSSNAAVDENGRAMDFAIPGIMGISSSKEMMSFRLPNARVAELADALDLGSSGVTRESSSLSFRTNISFTMLKIFKLDLFNLNLRSLKEQKCKYQLNLPAPWEND